VGIGGEQVFGQILALFSLIQPEQSYGYSRSRHHDSTLRHTRLRCIGTERRSMLASEAKVFSLSSDSFGGVE